MHQELSKNKNMQLKAAPVMMNLNRSIMHENTLVVDHAMGLHKEHQGAQEKLAVADNKSQTLPWKHSTRDTEHRTNDVTERYACAQLNRKTRTCSLGEDKVPVQSLETSNIPPFGKTSGKLPNDRLRQTNAMEKARKACMTLTTHSDISPENGIFMLPRQSPENATLKSIADENMKYLYPEKVHLEYAPPGEPPTRQGQAIEVPIFPDVQPGVISTHPCEGRPGAYAVAPSGSTDGTMHLPPSHETCSDYHESDNESPQNEMSNYHALRHYDGEVNIDQGEVGANMNNPVEAHIVDNDREAVFGEVVQSSKRSWNRWMLMVVVVLIAVIIVLGVCLRTTGSVRMPEETQEPTPYLTSEETQEPTPVPTPEGTQEPTSVPTPKETPPETQVPTPDPTPPGSNLIACSFLMLSLDDCQEADRVLRSLSHTTIPSELGVLTNITYLKRTVNELSGTIPTEIGALTNLSYLDLYLNQLNGTIPSQIEALTSLTFLNLFLNQFTGTIPSEIRALTNLQYLNLAADGLSGTIPSEIGNLTMLTILHLYDNELTGSIPSELGLLTSLQQFYLDNNYLVGGIPTELSNLNKTSWKLFNNALSGTIPTELCQSEASFEIDCALIECSCCNSFYGEPCPRRGR